MTVPATRAPRRLTDVARSSLPAAAAALTIATVAAGLVIRWGTRIELGTPLPPFLISWSPHLRWPALVGGAVSLGWAGVAPWLIARVRGRGTFAVVAYAGALAVGLSVNAARRGVGGWSHVFDLSSHGSSEAGREYLPALAQVSHGGIGHYVGHFAALLPYLPTHVKGNPPGPAVAMHLLSITSAGRLTAVCVGVGALCAPLTYALGATLGNERRGRVAAALATLSPALVLFGVTSVDYAFAAVGTATAWLLVAAPARGRAAGCALAAIGSFLSWVLLAIPVWAVLTTVRRDGLRTAVALAAGVVCAVATFNVALVVAVGYDPIAILRALASIYGQGAAAHRPYPFWLLGSPAAWLVMLGPPIAWVAIRSLAKGDPAALALAAVVGVAAVAGFTKAETERIWLPFVPLACVAAASLPIRRLRPVLVALAVQGLAVEVLFGTVW